MLPGWCGGGAAAAADMDSKLNTCAISLTSAFQDILSQSRQVTWLPSFSYLLLYDPKFQTCIQSAVV